MKGILGSVMEKPVTRVVPKEPVTEFAWMTVTRLPETRETL